MTRNRRVGGVSMYKRSLFGRKAKAQVDLGAHRRGIEKRLRRSHIFIARETRKAISSVGATSNLERPSMPLLAELVAFYVIVAIRFRSYGAGNPIALNRARKQITFFNPLLRDLAILTRPFAPEAVPLSPPRPFSHSPFRPVRSQVPPSS
jgi:hypothetical protein